MSNIVQQIKEIRIIVSFTRDWPLWIRGSQSASHEVKDCFQLIRAFDALFVSL
jgi:hypothetical protein